MSTKEKNVAGAILDAVYMLKEIIKYGLSEEKHLYATMRVISEKHNLSHKDVIIVLEESMKIV